MEIHLSLATDFTDGVIDSGLFQSQINADSSITAVCSHINTDGDDIDTVVDGRSYRDRFASDTL